MNPRPRVYLLRHGYSVFQEHFDATNADPGIVDAGLTERGRAQVSDAAAVVARLGIELVVTSPLTRAIETALGLFEASTLPPMLVDVRVRERLGDMCDVGRTPAELVADYPALDFAHLPERWWYDGPLDDRGVPMEPPADVDARAREFAEWVLARPERAILVVSHFGFLRTLGGAAMANCELSEWSGEVPLPPQ